jgi:hypothetical protein
MNIDELQEQIRRAYIRIETTQKSIYELSAEQLGERDEANQRIGYFKCLIDQWKKELLSHYPVSEWGNLPPFTFAEWEKPKTTA